MARSRGWLSVPSAVLLVTSAQTDYAEGLEQPPTEGIPTSGPGSGEALAALLHYTMQRTPPGSVFEDPSCSDVTTAEAGPTVTCQTTVGEEEQDRREFALRMDDEGLWQVSGG